MYEFTDSNEIDDDGDDPFESGAPLNPSEEREREWSKMSDQFVNAGYREGITAGKESAIQAGFDDGFAECGAPLGRDLGTLRGIVAGVLSLLQSTQHLPQGIENANELLAEVREISRGLSALNFVNLVPPDEEALAHAREHAELEGGNFHLPQEIAVERETSLAELSSLRQRLGAVLERLKLSTLLQ